MSLIIDIINIIWGILEGVLQQVFVVLPENAFLTVRNPLLEFTFNSPSDSDTDLPLVIQHFLRYFLGS